MSLKTHVTKRAEGNYIVSLEGSLDNDVYTEFKKSIESILENPIQILVLDLAGLEYVSTLGVGALISVKRLVEEHQGKFSMINVQPQVLKIFTIIKAIPDISIFGSLKEVDKYIDSVQKQAKDKDKNKDLL